MKKVFKILMIVVFLFVVALFGGRIYLDKTMRKSLPDYNQDIVLSGLSGDVEVFRDQYAVPHVYASSEEDLYKVTGYIMAQDRLWQMDLLRKVTQGRLTEIFGEKMLSVDILFRSMKINNKSLQIIDSTDHDILLQLEAFANGVNQYIEQNSDKLPVEFKILGYQPELWKPEHTINLIGYMAWSLKAGWSNMFLEEMRQKLGDEKCMELMPNITRQGHHVFPPNESDEEVNTTALLDIVSEMDKLGLGVFDASNNWAVSGAKSQSGKPLFANDMHLSYNIPGTWFQIHQVVKGKLDVTGLSLAGAPMVIVGHNEQIAWGMTNTYVDNLDFYEHKINPDNDNQYLYEGEWKDFAIEQMVFKDKKGKETLKKIRYDHRGPVISDFKPELSKIISMQWMGSQYSNELEAVFKLNRAQNWEQFRNAVKGFVALSQNINYADRDGNIGLQCSAGVPIRDRDILMGFLPGWTSKYEWNGLVPFEELPYEFNPERQFVSSANNRTVDDSYPYHIGTWYALPYRIERIREVLESNDALAPGDFMLLQSDYQSLLAQQFLPQFIQKINEAGKELSPQEKKALELLQNWDGNFDVNSNAALLFEELYLQTLKHLVKDEMGEEAYNNYLSDTKLGKYTMENAFGQQVFSWCDNINTKDKEENLSDIVYMAFKEAVKKGVRIQGKNMEQWNWGKTHKLTLEHPLGSINVLDRFLGLNKGPFPVGGSWHTVGPYSYNFGKPYSVVHGASHRHIYDLKNWDQSLTVIPTGNCGIPASEHYADQTELYVNNKYHQDYYSRKLVVENARYKMVARPE